jgi:hypothetical protein
MKTHFNIIKSKYYMFMLILFFISIFKEKFAFHS